MVKYYTLIFSVLLFSIANGMEKKEKEESGKLFLNATIGEAIDIYECIDMIDKTFAVFQNNKSLDPKEQWIKSKNEIRNYYIPYIKSKFLERREGKEGFYPKDEEWHNDVTINSNIAQFLEKRNNENSPLVDIIKNTNGKATPADVKLIQLLLFYGANPNFQDNDGNYALLFAVKGDVSNINNIEIVKCLLENDAHPNLKNNNGEASLNWAINAFHPIYNNNDGIIQILLKHNAIRYEIDTGQMPF